MSRQHKVKLVTKQYEAAYGHKPRGRGCYTCHITVDTSRGTFSANIVRMGKIKEIISFIQSVYKYINLSYEDAIELEVLP